MCPKQAPRNTEIQGFICNGGCTFGVSAPVERTIGCHNGPTDQWGLLSRLRFMQPTQQQLIAKALLQIFDIRMHSI
ncbi:hypothetical protein C0J52_16079 [Blattella germanica]|nr:hypothetical protein C0J52_16079 [Blattella germanica]